MTASSDQVQTVAATRGARIALRILMTIVVVSLAFFAGSWSAGGRRASDPVMSHASASTDSQWTCSMHPQIRKDEPGDCPLCGMTLVPVDVEEQPVVQVRPPKYACSMFCVPPMEKPGKCPVCGMEMVAVEEDVVGGAMSDQGLAEITLSPQAQKLAALQVSVVERRFADKEIRMVGKVEFDETRLGSITSRVPGRLDRLFVDYTGISVKKGDHLVYLYSPELLTAQEELIQALKAANDSRSSPLEGLRYAVEDALEAARSKLRLWGLTLEQVDEIEKRGTPSDHLTIYAPIGGVVIKKHVVEGMYVDTGTPIYTIADLTHVWVKLDAYESDLGWVRYGQKVSFETEAYPGEKFQGTIAFIDPVLNLRTRTVKVRVNVSNEAGRLKPGMFVRAVVHSRIAAGGQVVADDALVGKWICPMHPEIVKDAPGKCDVCGMPLVSAESLGYVSADASEAQAPLVIPVSAPLRTGTRAVVYVAVPDKPGRYEGRQVTLGPRAGDVYIVYDGLQEGEIVVTNGAFKIDSAMQILARPSMMSPGGGSTPPSHHHGDAVEESPGG